MKKLDMVLLPKTQLFLSFYCALFCSVFEPDAIQRGGLESLIFLPLPPNSGTADVCYCVVLCCAGDRTWVLGTLPTKLYVSKLSGEEN